MSSGFAASGAMLRWMVCGNLLRPCWGSWSIQSLRAMNGSVVVIQPRAVFDVLRPDYTQTHIQRPVIGTVAWSNVNVCSGHLMALLRWWLLEQMQRGPVGIWPCSDKHMAHTKWTCLGGCFFQGGGSYRGKGVNTERLGGEHNKAHDVKFPNN